MMHAKDILDKNIILTAFVRSEKNKWGKYENIFVFEDEKGQKNEVCLKGVASREAYLNRNDFPAKVRLTERQNSKKDFKYYVWEKWGEEI